MQLNDLVKNLFKLNALKQGDIVSSKKMKTPNILDTFMKGHVVFAYKMKIRPIKEELAKLKSNNFYTTCYKSKSQQIVFISQKKERIDDINSAILDIIMLMEIEDENFGRNTTISKEPAFV